LSNERGAVYERSCDAKRACTSAGDSGRCRGRQLCRTGLCTSAVPFHAHSSRRYRQSLLLSHRVASAAHAGAMYGVENSSDTAGMVLAAKSGVSNLSNVSATAAYGCECSDGTSPISSCTSTPSCTYNYVTYVDVTVTSRYKPVLGYPGLPSSMNITRELRLRVGRD
jgi:hypothetical protein